MARLFLRRSEDSGWKTRSHRTHASNRRRQAGLHGTWSSPRGPAEPGAQGKDAKAAPPPAPPTDGPPLATFFNIGANFKEGLPLRPWAADLAGKRKADNSKDNPDAHCLPMGLMQFHLHPQPRKIVQTPQEVLIIYEANSGLRQIFTDGRAWPGGDPEPWSYGYSIGHWDGDTLVVETTGYRDGVWLDVWGTPMASAGKTIERFRFTVRVNHRLSPDAELIEFICQDRDAVHYVGKQ